jgi:RNA polymerase sigma factor (sigma-70 family)
LSKAAAERTDPEITKALLGSVQQREQLFTWMYRASGWREWVLAHVRSEGGDEAAGQDVFQETLVLFDRNLREGRFQGNSSLKTYFLGIAKQYWFNRRRGIRPTALPEHYDMPTMETPEFLALSKERQSLVNQILEAIGEHCQKVLSLYKLSLSNEEIAREMGLSSPEMAKKYTYRCREKFKAYVLSQKDLLEQLDIRPHEQ